MSEILFHGKRKDNGEWVEGYYVWLNRAEHRIYTGYAETDCGEYYPEWHKVIPETVGQFTGLTDKNGVKIFEGDIVISRMSSLKYLVSWKDCQFEIKDKWGNIYVPQQEFLNHIELEIIGNIHDNPELLEEK